MAKLLALDAFLTIDTRDLGEFVEYRQVRNPRWLWLRRKTVMVIRDTPRAVDFSTDTRDA